MEDIHPIYQTILRVAADKYSATVEEIISRSRLPHIVDARIEACVKLKEQGLSHAAIA